MNKEYRIYMDIDLFKDLNKYVDSVGYNRNRIIENMINEFLKNKLDSDDKGDTL